MELSKDLDAMLTLNQDQALAVLNKVVQIHNHLLSEKPEFGWVEMGTLIERLGNILRQPEKKDEN